MIKTVDFMTENHLTEELILVKEHPGLGFGLGFSVVMDVPKTQTLGSVGAYGFSGHQ